MQVFFYSFYFFTSFSVFSFTTSLDKSDGIVYNQKAIVKHMTLHYDFGGGAMAKNMRVAYLLDFYGDLLTDKQKDSIDQYYNDDLSLGEIAADLGITRQGVRDNIKRGEAVLFEMEEKLGLAARFSEIKKGLETIRKSVDVIDQKNMRVYRSNEINDSIKVILKELDKLDKLNQ